MHKTRLSKLQKYHVDLVLTKLVTSVCHFHGVRGWSEADHVREYRMARKFRLECSTFDRRTTLGNELRLINKTKDNAISETNISRPCVAWFVWITPACSCIQLSFQVTVQTNTITIPLEFNPIIDEHTLTRLLGGIFLLCKGSGILHYSTYTTCATYHTHKLFYKSSNESSSDIEFNCLPVFRKMMFRWSSKEKA